MNRNNHMETVEIGTVGVLRIVAYADPESWSWGDLGDCIGTTEHTDHRDQRPDRARGPLPSRERGYVWWVPPPESEIRAYRDSVRKRGASKGVAADRVAEWLRSLYQYAYDLHDETVTPCVISCVVLDEEDEELGSTSLGMCDLDSNWRSRDPYWPGHVHKDIEGQIRDCVKDNAMDEEALDQARSSALDELGSMGKRALALHEIVNAATAESARAEADRKARYGKNNRHSKLGSYH